jgi:Vacuolar protein sorting-associated protein 62
MSTAAELRALLDKHQPYLRYDSHEAYFADDAAIFADSPGNTLQQANGHVLATAGAELSLALLSHDPYPGAAAIAWAKTDVLSIHDKQYRERAAELHMQPRYANVAYGHVVEDSRGATWLQYWYCYLFNDYNLIGGFLKAGLHEGDWETVQLRLGSDGNPDHAVYAQHNHAEDRPWDQIETVPGTDRPVVYVARGSHASYFEPGTKWTGVWFDYADGKRQSPERQRLVAVIDGDATLRWIRWTGNWGDTKGGGGIAPAESPRSPGVRKHWRDPLALLDVAVSKAAEPRPPRPAPPAAPSVTITRTEGGGAELAWAVTPAADGELPTLLTVTINSKDEATPPMTTNKPITGTSGTLGLPDLDPAKRYDIFVSDATAAGLASESVRRDLVATA